MFIFGQCFYSITFTALHHRNAYVDIESMLEDACLCLELPAHLPVAAYECFVEED